MAFDSKIIISLITDKITCKMYLSTSMSSKTDYVIIQDFVYPYDKTRH
jgi:hypothetical protein